MPASYQFKYDVNAPEYGVKFGHEESKEGEEAWGRYNVLLPDGRTQIVEYEADHFGYRPKITYEQSQGGGYGGSGTGTGNAGYQYRK